MELTMAWRNRRCVISLGSHKISNGSIGARRIEGSILLLYIQPQHVSVTWQWPTELVYRQSVSWDVVSNRSCLAALPLPAVKWNAAWARDTAWIWLLLILLDWLRLGHLNWRIYKSGLDVTELLKRDASPSRFLSDISVRKWPLRNCRRFASCRSHWPPIWGSMQQPTGDGNMDRDGRDGVSFSLPASASRVRLASRDSCRHRTKERLFVREPSGSELNLAWLSSAPRWTN